jgi:3-hydroxyacyl-CoA dehydrogenase
MTTLHAMRPLRTLGIIGPGLMGQGIARIAERAGVQVRLLGRGAGLEPLVQCDLVVESVPEDRALKVAVLTAAEQAMGADALLASNTSGLPVTGLGRSLVAPHRFLGLHFFSPVERMRLVEVVRGVESSDAAVAQALAWVRQLGQEPILVRDGPGFFTSRVFATYLDEAVAMVGEGVAVERIDAAGLALGRAIGPLALLDSIGLTLNLQQSQQAQADGLPTRFCRPLARPVLEVLVGAGRAGRRAGGGFYSVPNEKAAGATAATVGSGAGSRLPWAGLREHFPPRGPAPSDEHIQQRLRWVEVVEALRCLEEGVIGSADEVDTASVLGLGFPAATGGLLRWAEQFSAAHGVATAAGICAALAQQHGTRFEPPTLLKNAAPLLRMNPAV